MVVRTIHVTRHAFRASYTLNSATGEYHTNSQSPTGIPSDPPLASYGVQQSHELVEALTRLDPGIDHVYSSPFYRCLQTVQPAIERLGSGVKVRVDNGIGEWYGAAHFDHPSPAPPAVLSSLFPSCIDEAYEPSIIPPRSGETIEQLHDRVAQALDHIIARADAESSSRDVSILLCTHAATLIAISRTLTGDMPSDSNEDDFLAPTAGLTKFIRKQISTEGQEKGPPLEWKGGKGIAGGWTCVLNGNCDHLAGGAERSWHFSGEEAFGKMQSTATPSVKARI